MDLFLDFLEIKPLAASIVGTAQRIISQPACSRAGSELLSASTSSVFVFVMDWIKIGLPPNASVSDLNHFCMISVQ